MFAFKANLSIPVRRRLPFREEKLFNANYTAKPSRISLIHYAALEGLGSIELTTHEQEEVRTSAHDPIQRLTPGNRVLTAQSASREAA